MEKLIIKRFPMPPSINAQLKMGRGRFIKTDAARIFDHKVFCFKLKNGKALDEFGVILKKEVDLGFSIQVDCYFILDEKRLIGKKGQIKQLDVNNFLKSSLDGLVKCLGIDDKYFKAHFIECISCKSSVDEQIIFVINTKELRQLSDIIIELEKGG